MYRNTNQTMSSKKELQISAFTQGTIRHPSLQLNNLKGISRFKDFLIMRERKKTQTVVRLEIFNRL